MTPAPRRKPAVGDPGPVRLATPHPPDVGPIDPPEDPRPEAKRGPTLPAGFGRQPEAPLEARPGRKLPASIEPMLHIDDLAALLSCSRRLVERMRSAGKVPKPDIHVGKCPRWKPATIRAWIERGGKT
jgi:predicted DNA-binding transcriptional regulator AlpA